MNLRVCILAAGTGSRLGKMGHHIHKALLPIQHKAVLTHILEKFPKDTTFVIAVGYLSNHIKDYLALAHPDLKFEYVQVDPYEGPGSGPGTSVYQCRSKLNQPFFIVCADTLWHESIPLCEAHSWISTTTVPKDEAKNYCVIHAKDNLALGVSDKIATESNDPIQAFTGLMYVYDHELFFSAYENDSSLKNTEVQLSQGILALIKQQKLNVLPLTTWEDVGTLEKYLAVKRKYEFYDMAKDNEALYFIKNKVIKFNTNKEIIKNRVFRSQLPKAPLPKITGVANHFYSYDFIEGKNLYQTATPKLFDEFLNWLDQEIWDDAPNSKADFEKYCLAFYKEKTLHRLQMFAQKHNVNYFNQRKVNEVQLEPLNDLLNSCPWNEISKGIPKWIHGDLQFSNVIYRDSDHTFHLLDWREDFAGQVEFGDLYYDFAKLLAGWTIDLSQLEQKGVEYKPKNLDSYVQFQPIPLAIEYKSSLKKYVEKNGYSWKKVELLVPIIFLNMAPLHQQPFDRALFDYGHYLLQLKLKEYNEVSHKIHE